MFLGYLIRPFSPKSSRQLITATPKFYFFDPSLPLLLRQQTIKALKGAEAGHALENYLMLELIAYREIRNKRFCINYWRSKTGLEVDFILNKGKIAIEVKISNSLANKELKAIASFSQEYKPEAAYVICLEEKKRLLTLVSRPIIIYPIEEFLQDLWQGKII